MVEGVPYPEAETSRLLPETSRLDPPHCRAGRTSAGCLFLAVCLVYKLASCTAWRWCTVGECVPNPEAETANSPLLAVLDPCQPEDYGPLSVFFNHQERVNVFNP